MGYRRKSVIEELLEMLYEITGMSWKIGAVITTGIMLLAIAAFFTVMDWHATGGSSTMLAPMVRTWGWIGYALPAGIWFLGYIFGSKTYEVYLRQNRY